VSIPFRGKSYLPLLAAAAAAAAAALLSSYVKEGVDG
jgi:hypothetical protein